MFFGGIGTGLPLCFSLSTPKSNEKAFSFGSFPFVFQFIFEVFEKLVEECRVILLLIRVCSSSLTPTAGRIICLVTLLKVVPFKNKLPLKTC